MDDVAIDIEGVSPDVDLRELLGDLPIVAAREGFAMVWRLVDDWAAGTNCFDAPGELLVVARVDGDVVGVGGLNHDPWASMGVARVRRLYVRPDARRSGLGRALLARVVAAAGLGGFHTVRLRTTTVRGAAFFESCGFVAVTGEPEATHVLAIGSPP